MAYPSHYLLQFGGNLGAGGEEIWSCGIRLVLQNEIPSNFNPADGYLADTAKTALSQWFLRAESRIANHCTLTYAKCNEINAAGEYAQNDTNEYYYPAAVYGGGGSSSLPWQCSVVLSWETDNATRGPASKGRIYSPAPVVTVDGSTGLFTQNHAAQMAGSAAQLLNSLDDSVGLSGQVRPHIVSNVGNGSANEINQVRVDNVVDTQRRRRNALRGTSSIEHFDY